MKDYLYSLRNTGAKLGLERVQRLAGALGNPERGFRSVLVGGTSGKGSTVAMLSSILMAAGYRVGTFTSPHLSDLTERICVDGQRISEGELEGILEGIKAAIEDMKKDEGFEHPTFFEVMAAAAFLYFKERGVDFAVLEVGLGGRLDATNIAPADVSVITNVSLEHMRILGSTVEKIAVEKAGIVKGGGLLVTGAKGKALQVLERACAERDCRILRVGKELSLARKTSGIKGQGFELSLPGGDYELRIPLLGMHQLENAACAVAAAEALGIAKDAVGAGLERARWPGRMEVMSKEPLVVLDCAKDPEAMARLRDALHDLEYARLILVLGISSDKDIGGMVDAIVPAAHLVILTAHKVMGRAADPGQIAEAVEEHGKEHLVVEDVKEATKKAISMAGKGDLVLVTGSLFTVGEARELWEKEEPRWGRGYNEIPRG